ncbi:uncharacterized protein B0H64DRAFT_351122 [Chaetomium fimeti]|uniref:F-box domain-containing protein n=1 Tax=Chaetomium fimeti TaxID=1854472 RepID=A0AAE0LWZ8_9PEZI|nr:hypothetical protein B0H64DRAFT_351122 [Chaetomium fimeti]
MATDSAKSIHHDLPGFLRLPPKIRHSIYLLVWGTPWEIIRDGNQINLFFECSMPEVFDLCGPYDPSTKSYNIPPVGFRGLLLSCRAIHTETSALLYSSNMFFCHYEALRSLAPLRELRPESVASMTRLKIILNQSSCHSRGSREGNNCECCDETRLYTVYYPNEYPKEKTDCKWRHHGVEHDDPLRRSHPSTKPIIAEWYKTAAHLGPLITPGQLELYFVCDVYSRDTQLATMVLDAFRHFPPLKDCHIRLSRTPDPALHNLAQTTVLKARGIKSRVPPPPLPPPPPTGNCLVGLPRELRLRILEYTDLVTPLKEVMWTRSHGKYLASRPSCPSWEGRGDHMWAPDIHHGCQFTSCSQRPYPRKTMGCYCQLTHSAASSTCHCWATPTPLFLVCHALRHDANLVFFSENRFVVIDSPSLSVFGPPRESGYDRNRFAVSQFLTDVVPVDCLSHLRLVEMVFPPYLGHHWPRKGDPVLKDWSDTINQVKDHLNLPALTIRMLAVYREGEDHYDTGTLTSFEATEAVEAYFHVLRPLLCDIILGQPRCPDGTCRHSRVCSAVGLHAAGGPRWPNAERRSPPITVELKRCAISV